jgi:NAD-dependent dihydropyrimidine dehydrogenase PreA subunit
MNAISIDLDKCDGCRSCVKACFVNVLTWDRQGKRPRASHAEDCAHCNLCELACPKDCISVVPDYGCMRWPAL